MRTIMHVCMYVCMYGWMDVYPIEDLHGASLSFSCATSLFKDSSSAFLKVKGHYGHYIHMYIYPLF
jgi:hypothetical protein